MTTRRTTKKTTTKTKADQIRDWYINNPNGTAVQCQKALAEQGVKVGSGQCQQILNQSKGGGKVDVNSIKSAAEFVAGYKDVNKAMEAIDGVADFIQACGNAKKAKAALEAYKTVAAVVK